MPLRSTQRRDLAAALAAAFPSWQQLADMVALRLRRPLSYFASDKTLRDAVMDLIEAAESGGWTRELVTAAVDASPEHDDLRKIAMDLGLVEVDLVDRWSRCAGPRGSGVECVTADPSNDGVLYAGMGGRNDDNKAPRPPFDTLFKSIDDGRSWASVGDALEGRSVIDIAVGSAGTGLVYAGTTMGLFKSTEGGMTWRLDGQRNAELQITSIVLSPDDDGTIYVGSAERPWGGMQITDGTGAALGSGAAVTSSADARAGGFHRTVDAGASWATAPIKDIMAIAVSTADPNHIYLGSNKGVLYRSTDRAASLQPASSFSGRIRCLATDPRAPNRLLIGGPGLWISSDGGVSCSRVDDFALDTVFDVTFMRGDPTRVLAATSRGVHESLDGGATWRSMRGSRMPRRVLSITVSRSGVLCAGTDGGGVYRRSADAASSWSQSAGGLRHLSGLCVLLARNGRVYCGTPSGLYRSDDGGRSWHLLGFFDDDGADQVWALHLLNRSAAQPREKHGAKSGFHVTRDSGQTWRTLGETDEADVLYVGTERGRIYSSADGGASWALFADLAKQAGGGRVRSIAQWPGGDGSLYATSVGAGVFRSDDGGKSWRAVNHGIPNGIVTRLSSTTAGGPTFYLGSTDAVYRTTDGETWVRGEKGLPQARTLILSLAASLRAAGKVYAATSDGVYVSVDGAESWSRAGEGTRGRITLSVALSPDEDTIFAGTTEGVLQSADGGRSWIAMNDGFGDHRGERHVNFLAVGTGEDRMVYAGTGTGLYRLQRS